MMGMASVTPKAKESDVVGAFAILAVLGDDNKYKARLKELQDLANKANAHHAEAKDSHAAADLQLQNAEKLLSKAQALRDEGVAAQAVAENVASASHVDMTRREQALEEAKRQHAEYRQNLKQDFERQVSERRAELDAKEQQLAEMAATHAAKASVQVKALKDREDAVSARERDVALIRANAEQRHAELVKAEAALADKHAKLRDLIG